MRRRPPASGSRRRERAAPGWRWVLPAALVGLMLPALASAFVLGLRAQPLALAVDGLLLLALLALLRPAVRSPRALFVLASALGVIGILAHAVKLAYLGAAVHPGDGAGAIALLRVMPTAAWFAFVPATLALLAALVLPLRASARGAAVVLGVVVFGAGLLAAAPWLERGLQRVAPVQEGDDRGRFLAHGGILPFFVRWHEWIGDERTVPEADAVRAVLERYAVTPQTMTATSAMRRNLHLILVEALWDARQLEGYRWSRDPIDPRLLRAWEQAGRSHVLVPTFGGATANGEYEALCGLPAHASEVVFATRLHRASPCLPRLLRDAGYRTVASHPYLADFWNRNRAYALLGFEYYYPLRAFQLDDFDGGFLSDASSLSQVRARQSRTSDPRPRFEYLVTLSSHFPFDRDRSRRPDQVDVQPPIGLLPAYANALAHSTAAVMDHVEAILAQDPDALVALFGDHAPVLGVDPDPYAPPGGTPSAAPDDARLLAWMRTPALVIDGRAGPLAIGDVPLRQLPALLLSRLSVTPPALPQFSLAPEHRDAWNVHRFMGRYAVRRGARWTLCSSEAPCDDAIARYEELSVLRRDLARGQQHALTLTGQTGLARPLTMQILGEHAPCSLEVLDWGPRWTRAGQGFNVQDSGRSALWFVLQEGRGEPELAMGEHLATLQIAADRAAASFAPDLQLSPGVYPVSWRCEDGTRADLGEFYVLGPDDAAPAPGEIPQPPGCEVEVLDYGPREVVSGEAFNVQPDGRSAIWISLGPGSRRFTVHGPSGPLRYLHDGDHVGIPLDAPLRGEGDRPGRIDIELRCGTEVEARLPIEVLLPASAPG